MKKKFYIKLASLFIGTFFLMPSNTYSQDGSLDLSFGVNGKVITKFESLYDGIGSLAIQSDGKIVVVGNTFLNGYSDFTVVRYNSDGSLDLSFGSEGKVFTDIGTLTDLAQDVAIQSDGKIVVVGCAYVDGVDQIATVRYNEDGTLDNSFGTNGIVTTPIGSSYSIGNSVAIQSDGKIVVAGQTEISTYVQEMIVLRYYTDGTLDPAFNAGGTYITEFGVMGSRASSVAIQINGKIVVGGNSANDGNPNFAIIRLKDDGNADNSFSYDGIDTISVGGVIDYGRSVVVQSDEKIILAGYSHNGTDNDFALVRYNTNGTLDSSFGKDGIVTTAIGSSNDQISSMILQQDGRIVVAGNSYYNRSYDFALARYNIDGTLDTSFDSDGKQVTGFGNNSDFASSVALQSDGKIVVAGTTQEGFNSDFALARYNNTILTGVDEIQAEVLSVEIYADPTTDKLLVKAGSELVGSSYTVIDQLGRPIISGRLISESSSVAIDKLASGLYFFQVVGGNQMTVKFMKK